MVIATLAGVVGLVTVLVALYREDAVLDPVPEPGPAWGALPAPNDVARPTFRLALPGYDPVEVDATVEALVVAYEELWTAAGPDARARARRGAARRRGLVDAGEDGAARRPIGASALPLADEEPGPEAALRAAAALAVLQRAQHGR